MTNIRVAVPLLGHEDRLVVSTVTTPTTTTTVTTAATGVAAALDVVAVGSVIAFLMIKELSAATEGPRIRVFGHHLDVVIFPLLIAFAAIVTIKIVEILT